MIFTLRRVGITTEKSDAYEARNGFYSACAADKMVRALGFDDSGEFPIKRKDFARLNRAAGTARRPAGLPAVAG